MQKALNEKKDLDEQLDTGGRNTNGIFIERPFSTSQNPHPVNGNYSLPDEDDETEDEEEDLILGDEDDLGDEEEFDVELEEDVDEADIDEDDLVIDADDDDTDEDDDL